MIQEKKIKIWEDAKQKPGFLVYFLTFIIPLVFFIGFIISFGSFDSLLLFILTILFSLIFVLGIRIKYIIIEKEGIWSGNNTSGQMINKIFILKQKNNFILFKNIDELKIKEKNIYFSYVANKSNFLIIKTKDGKEYECAIADPRGFIDALKKLNKHHLLSKDSRYK